MLKRAELEELARWSGLPVAMPAQPRTGDLFSEKVRHRLGIRMRVLAETCDMESNLRPDEARTWAGESFSYLYQRTGFTNYQLSNALYAGDDPDTPLDVAWTSSGQVGISCLLMAAAAAWPGATIDFPPGGYWETREFLGRLQPTGAPAGPRILYLDSTNWDGRDPGLDSCSCVFFDTTCFARDEPLIQHARDLALRQDVPLFLMRSHLKLDGLGMEFRRLGSVACQRAAGGTGDALWHEFVRHGRWFGLFAQYTQVYPFLFDATFARLNAAWLSRIRAVHRAVRRALEQRFDPARFAFFTHETFFYVFVATDQERAQLTLSRILTLMGLGHVAAASFPFDFISITGFVGMHDEQSGITRPTVRVCLGDTPLARLDDLIRALTLWLDAIDDQ